MVELALASKDGLHIETLASSLGINGRTIRRTVEDLIDLGVEITKERVGNNVIYRLANPRQGGVLRPVMAERIATDLS
jgi:predicted transcriptional regulator